MINPVKEKEDKIRYDYIKKELTFDDYKKTKKQRNLIIIIFVSSAFLFFYISLCLGSGLYYLNKSHDDTQKLYKEGYIELGGEICSYLNQDFVNIQLKELPNGEKRMDLICSETIKLFPLGR